MSKSKIRLREDSIEGLYGFTISEGDNHLELEFSVDGFRASHNSDCHFNTVAYLRFPYTDRREFIEKLYRWCSDNTACIRFDEGLEVGVCFIKYLVTDEAFHGLDVRFITNFKQKLKTKLEEEVIEVVDENPMPKPLRFDVVITTYDTSKNYWMLPMTEHCEIASIYRPKNGKLELIWSREG